MQHYEPYQVQTLTDRPNDQLQELYAEVLRHRLDSYWPDSEEFDGKFHVHQRHHEHHGPIVQYEVQHQHFQCMRQ